MNTYTLNIGGELLPLDSPWVMGIMNVTPDSFYEGSRTQADDDIAARARQIVAEGGRVIDIGGCSTRPDSEPAGEEEEMDRLCRGLAISRRVAPKTVLSIDTFRPEVARVCVECFGPLVINDVSGGCDEMYETVARLHVPYILTYNNSRRPLVGDDIVTDCLYFLAQRIERLHDLGVADIIVDPGFGFGKTLDENYALVSALDSLHELDAPVLVGVSRKSMIYRLLNSTPKEALNGTTALHTIALHRGVHILRAHDVRQAVEAVEIYSRLTHPAGNRIRCVENVSGCQTLCHSSQITQ